MTTYRVREWIGPFLGCLLLVFVSWPQAQPRYGTALFIQASEPATGIYPGAMWFDTSSDTLKLRTGTATWTTLSGPSSSALPSGFVGFVVAGSCPAGTTEVTSLNGKTLVGTLAANADVGSTGGADSLAPAGTVAAPVFTGTALSTHGHTFTGNALATHAHELPFQIPTGTSLRQIASSTFGTGTSRAATATITTTANTTSAAVARSQAVTAGTPAGSINSVSAGTPAGTNSAPAFTGTPFDNRSAFTKVIFCGAS